MDGQKVLVDRCSRYGIALNKRSSTAGLGAYLAMVMLNELEENNPEAQAGVSAQIEKEFTILVALVKARAERTT